MKSLELTKVIFPDSCREMICNHPKETLATHWNVKEAFFKHLHSLTQGIRKIREKKLILPSLGIFALIIAGGCTLIGNDNARNSGKRTTSIETLEMGVSKQSSPAINNLEHRIEEDLRNIRACVNELNVGLKEQNAQLTITAKLKSEQFRKDLERIEKELENAIKNFDSNTMAGFELNAYDVQYQLEQAEDEMAQINDELQEWYEKNLN